MASGATENRRPSRHQPVAGAPARSDRPLCSLAMSLAIPLSLNAAVILLFGSGRKLDGIPSKPLWIPPLWVVHAASISSSLLMGLASWLVRARGRLRVDSDALPLYVAQVSLAVVWDPLVLVIGSYRAGSVLCAANFGTLVACKSSFQKATRMAGDIVSICAVWAGFLTVVTIHLSFL